jgi:hypothetical protein
MFEDVQAFYDAMKGDWRGGYDLWLMPTSPKESSESTAEINNGVMNYQWAQGEKSHQGAFDFGGSGKEANFSWSDSFHSSNAAMKGSGSLSEDGSKLVFMSHYSAGDDQPEWGWRTEFTFSDPQTLKMEAHNITPEGQEALAVRCDYVKQ